MNHATLLGVATCLALAACGSDRPPTTIDDAAHPPSDTPRPDASTLDVAVAMDVIAPADAGLDVRVADGLSGEDVPVDEVLVADVAPSDAGSRDAGAPERDVSPDGAADDASDGSADVPEASDVGVGCAAGAESIDGGCAPTAPRPLSPQSLCESTSRRPVFRWALAVGVDGAVLDLCRDRDCAGLIETVRVNGTSARPIAELPARSAIFWRLRGLDGRGAEGVRHSPVWLLHTPTRSTPVETCGAPHLDVNGDGYDDVAAGAVNAWNQTGEVHVFLGGPGGVVATPYRVLSGRGVGGAFGAALASAGDLNGDGYGELVVGAPRATPGEVAGVGTASVYFGGPGGFTGLPFVLQGVTVGEHVGASVAGIGDLDGDGYGDLAVGATSDLDGSFGRGRVDVFRGGATGVGAAPSYTRTGTTTSAFFGSEVASAGDVNGDGFADLFVGAPLGSVAGRDRVGTASVYLGGAAGLAASPARVWAGDSLDSRFGSALAGAGDVNGDGFSDLVVGAWQETVGGETGRGAASVYLGGATGPGAAAARVIADGLIFGRAVAGAGDLDGDGYGDLLVGEAYGGSGRVRVYLGSSSGIGPAAARVLNGDLSHDDFGSAVAGAGDLNGDGLSDFLVGAHWASPGRLQAAGSVSVYLGRMGAVSATPARVLAGTRSYDGLGATVALVH
ncbi:MAG: hypothetical protein EPO40_01710 [Myxococcaceae bacterium]|nr:MAG: hypothetical protein EPO40_01710 [Myxococcaceae bacterium]